MKRLSLLLILSACAAAPGGSNEPVQASEQTIAKFVADVSPELSAADQAAVANCGAQNTTADEAQRLAEVQIMDAMTTGLISEIMTRDGTLACMESNGVAL